MQHDARDASSEALAGSKTEPDFQLTDEQWNLISEFFPDPPSNRHGGQPPIPARDRSKGVFVDLASRRTLFGYAFMFSIGFDMLASTQAID